MRPPQVERLFEDVRHAVRGFRRSPGFAATVVIMLAVAIGANTAIFSLVDRLLLRELPYPESDRLAMVYEVVPGSPATNVSPGNWLDWQRLSQSFETFAAWVYTTATMTGENEPELLTGQAVSYEFFPSLKVLPQLGRPFSPEDDTPSPTSPGANMSSRVVILSHGLWQRRFGGDSNIVGRKVELDAAMYEVIGVMPQGFYFLNPLVEFWVPFALDRRRDWRATSGRIMTVVGRLKPGVSMTTAQTEMRTIAGQLEQLYDFNKNSSVSVVPLREVLTGEIRPSLLALLGAVSVLLLIACFNVASMMLARSASRRREIAVRAAVGAGRGALLRQLLVESLLLAVIGGAAGFLVALWATSALVALSPRNLVRVTEVPLDGRILTYTSIVSVLTGLIFGLAPAITATRGSLGDYLHSFGRSVTRSARIREWLVVAQVTMTLILLCGAGLLVRSFNALNSVPTGLKSNDVLTMQITMPAARYDRDQQVDFVTRTVQRLQSLPGVQSAGATRSLPVIGPTAGTGLHVKGTPDRPMMERPMTRVRMSTPGYFTTVGVPIIRGRDFNWDDLRPNAEPVFIVNDAFVKAHLPGQDPINVSIRVFMGSENPFGRIVGVTGDVREGSLRNDSVPTVFYNQRQLTYSSVTLFLRTNRPTEVARAAVQAIHDLDGNIPVTQIRPLTDAFVQSIARERLNAVVTAGFASTALLLASLGLYGLLAFLVAERTREIGIRMALGAEASALLKMVMKHGLLLVTSGAALGLIGAFSVSRLIQTLLFGIPSYDPVTFVTVVVLLIFLSALAALVPAKRATRVDPVVALRQE